MTLYSIIYVAIENNLIQKNTLLVGSHTRSHLAKRVFNFGKRICVKKEGMPTL